MARRTDLLFERWGRLVARHPVVVAAASLALAAALISPISRLSVDMSVASYLPRADPARRTYEAFRERFGSDQQLLIVIRPPVVFAHEFLAELVELETSLRDQLVKLRIGKATSKAINNADFKRIRADIARIKTIQTERKLGIARS